MAVCSRSDTQRMQERAEIDESPLQAGSSHHQESETRSVPSIEE